MAKRAGYIDVSTEFIHYRFLLPDNVTVVGAETRPFDRVRLLLEGTGLPEVGDDGEACQMHATYRRMNEDACPTCDHAPAELDRWETWEAFALRMEAYNQGARDGASSAKIFAERQKAEG